MYMKCRYLDEFTGSKGVVFATGTPVSNSMVELYTMQRYLQHDRLEALGLNHFDAWAANFGETVTALELAPEGTGYRTRTRFSKFFNLPELMSLFREVADIKTADELNLPRPKVVYHTEVSQPTEIQKELVKQLSERASKVHARQVEPDEDNMLAITNDGRKLGLDQRVVNPLLPDEPETKVNRCVDNVFKNWEDTKADRLTQLIFCDLSTPGKSVTFYKDGQRAIRLHTLGEGYSEAELRAVITGKTTHSPRGKRESASPLIDIEAKLAAGKGGGYERWAKVFNVKQMAKTLLYLQEHGIKSRAELTARADVASEKRSSTKERITALDARIAEVNELRGQIIAYEKTREVFAEYKATRYSHKYYAAHADEIEKHREAKRYFNEHDLSRLPKVKDLNAEFSALIAEKREAYADYRALRDEHRELLIHRENVERFLSGEKSNPDRRSRGER